MEWAYKSGCPKEYFTRETATEATLNRQVRVIKWLLHHGISWSECKDRATSTDPAFRRWLARFEKTLPEEVVKIDYLEII